MRAVIQKVTHAEVDVISADSRETCGRIGSGFVVLLGVTHRDTETDAKYIADKTANLRIFEDETGKLNLSLIPAEQFCLFPNSHFTPMHATAADRPSQMPRLPHRPTNSTVWLPTCCAPTGCTSKQDVSKPICR